MSHVQADKLLQQINTKGDQNVANIEPKKKKKEFFPLNKSLKPLATLKYYQNLFEINTSIYLFIFSWRGGVTVFTRNVHNMKQQKQRNY